MTIRQKTIIKRLQKIGATAILHRDGPDDVIRFSAEDGKGLVDYYGEFRGGDPYIDPRIEKIADAADSFWEWENPGCIALYPA